MHVKKERSGWRDEALSRRHRQWGYNCPAVDIDFLMIEYDMALPVALIEYKHEGAPLQKPSHSSYRALAALATRAGIPFYGVRYTNDLDSFRVVPLNPLAVEILPERTQYSETQYVQFLYQLRQRIMPDDLEF